jgi:arylsulfatase A-like enzyme/dienelactone hydrolase
MFRFVAVLGATLSAMIAPPTAHAAGSQTKPNIVIILTDDQGYADVGCFGATDIKTPNMDRLAKEGTRFTSFYVAQPVCTASRAALLTGCYSNRVGLGGALNHTSTVGISKQETLLSELCKKQGYATGIFGKWHLGHQPQFLPTRRGFDEWFGTPYPNDNGPLHPVVKGLPPLPLFEGDTVIEYDPDQSQFTRRITERSVAFIEKNKDRPFFLYVPHIMPHVPIHASERFRGTSQRGLYGDVIQELDWSVGEILAALTKNGLDDNTIVAFTSDNGPFLSYGEHAGSAGSLRGGKLTTFEGGVRMPAMLRWPGHVPAGRVVDELVTTMDWFVALAKWTGAPLPKHKIDGVDLTDLLTGKPEAKGRDTFWYYSGDELHAVRQGDWKLDLPHEYLVVAAEPGKSGKPSNFANIVKPDSIQQTGIRGIATRHGYKYETTGVALYDLKADPGETKDVAAQHADVVERLQKVAAAARADLGDSLTKTPGPGVRPAGDVRKPLPEGVKLVANLEYARRPDAGGLLLDLYLPSRPAFMRPVVLWIHGGGWKNGNKENCPLTWLATEGIAVASMDYRLIPWAKWPAQLDDCRDAVHWLRANADKYGLDGQHIAASGGSAGGHLAAVLGAESPSMVQAVIDMYGPADLLTMPSNLPGPGKTDADLAKTNGAVLLGGIVRDRPELAKQASAFHLASKSSAPFLILHGDKDPQVPLSQSERLAAKLKELGVPVTLHVVQGGGHGGKGFDTPEVRGMILEFLREHLYPKKDP